MSRALETPSALTAFILDCVADCVNGQCTDALHMLITSDEARFEAGCTNIRPWPGKAMVIGECENCHSTLSLPVDPADVPEQQLKPNKD